MCCFGGFFGLFCIQIQTSEFGIFFWYSRLTLQKNYWFLGILFMLPQWAKTQTMCWKFPRSILRVNTGTFIFCLPDYNQGNSIHMMNDHVKLFTFLVWCKCPGMSEVFFFYRTQSHESSREIVTGSSLDLNFCFVCLKYSQWNKVNYLDIKKMCSSYTVQLFVLWYFQCFYVMYIFCLRSQIRSCHNILTMALNPRPTKEGWTHR